MNNQDRKNTPCLSLCDEMLHLMCINFLISNQCHSDTTLLSTLCVSPAPPCRRGNRGTDWRFTITAVQNPNRRAGRRVSLDDLYNKNEKKKMKTAYCGLLRQTPVAVVCRKKHNSNNSKTLGELQNSFLNSLLQCFHTRARVRASLRVPLEIPGVHTHCG